MFWSRILRAALLVVTLSLFGSQAEAQDVIAIDLTGMDPDVNIPLPAGAHSSPFDFTMGGLGPNAAAAEGQALQNAVNGVVAAAEFIAWLSGVDVVIEIRVSEQVGATTPEANGGFHAKWRLAGRFVWHPNPPNPGGNGPVQGQP